MLRSGHPPDAAAGPSRAASDVATLHATLQEYLQLEHKFQPRLCLPSDPESGEVTTSARDGAAHVMRCLKVWFDLPADVLFHAINLFDRFLTKMKVRPCHVPCITVACLNIAIEEHAALMKQARQVSVEELVSISQSTCTARDVERMSRVLEDKLALAGPRGRAPPAGALHWLRLLAALLRAAGVAFCEESELITMLEIVSLDHTCANARTSALALVVLFHKLEKQLEQLLAGGSCGAEDAYRVYECARELQLLCRLSDACLLSTRQLVLAVEARYEAAAAAPQRQRLVWRLSERTLKILRPTDRLTSLLPTIEEQHLPATPPRKGRPERPESESEETSDWPRSPVLPVYCD